MVYRDNWRTEDFAVYPQRSICFNVPDNEDFQRSMFGALYLLAQPYNWTQVGTATPEQTAQEWATIIDNAEFGSALLPLLSIYPNLANAAIIPASHVLCNGMTYTKDEYPQAYNNIVGIYRDTVTETFTVPNLTGRFMRGQDTTYPIGTTGGEDTVTLTVTQIPAHTHSEIIPVTTIINGGLEAPANAAIPSSGVTGSAGGGGSHNNIPRFHSVRYRIILST